MRRFTFYGMTLLCTFFTISCINNIPHNISKHYNNIEYRLKGGDTIQDIIMQTYIISPPLEYNRDSMTNNDSMLILDVVMNHSLLTKKMYPANTYVIVTYMNDTFVYESDYYRLYELLLTIWIYPDERKQLFFFNESDGGQINTLFKRSGRE